MSECETSQKTDSENNPEEEISSKNTAEQSENKPSEESSPKEELSTEPVTLSAEEFRNLSQNAEEFQVKYWQLLADSENSRKRLQKERQEMNKHGIRNVILDFLQPLDTFEAALNSAENGSEEVKNWAVGFQMILNQLKEVLNNYNVKSFSTKGMLYDPHHHEAVETVETTEHAEGTILHEFAKGYKMGDTTIRPASVKVAKAPRLESPKESEEKLEEDINKTEEKK